MEIDKGKDVLGGSNGKEDHEALKEEKSVHAQTWSKLLRVTAEEQVAHLGKKKKRKRVIKHTLKYFYEA